MGRVPKIDLTEQEYAAIKTAQNILTNGLSMEEKYDLVISNYLDFEEALLNSALHSMIKGEYTYHNFFLIRALFNRRVVNLLTAARLYRDQLQRHVESASPDDRNAKQTIRQLFSKEYDLSFEYRFMEELRNTVQHFGFPVHWTNFGPSWDSLGEQGNLQFSVDVWSRKTNLEADDSFKGSILEEAPDEIDLKKTVRKYVEAISRVHIGARALVQESILAARSAIEKAISRYRTEYSGSMVGLFVIRVSDEGEFVDRIPVMLEWDDIRVQLEKRNKLLRNLSKRYVSSKIQQ